MKFFTWGAAFFMMYFVYGFYIHQSEIIVISEDIHKKNPEGFYDYKGVLNIHSDVGLGSSSTSEIIEEAQAAGLDFMIFSDLNSFNPNFNLEAYHNNLLVLSGAQYNYLDNRILLYSAKKDLYPNNISEVHMKLTDSMSQHASDMKESLQILTHSNKASNRIGGLREIEWSQEFPTGIDGLEVLNQKSLSEKKAQTSRLTILWSLITYPFSPRLSFLRLISEPSEEIAMWDRLNQINFKSPHLNHPIFGFHGADATARAIPLANYFVRFPSYKKSFEMASNHLLLKSELTGNFSNDRTKIVNAFKSGNFYFAFDLIGDPSGFNAVIKQKDKIYLMGSELKKDKNTLLSFKLPAKPNSFFEVVIYKNGERFKTFNESSGTLNIEESGVYRLIVRVIPLFPIPEGKKWITWIYTNPFFVY